MLLIILSLIIIESVYSQNFTGKYTSNIQGNIAKLNLYTNVKGQYEGTLSGLVGEMKLIGTIQGGKLSGSLYNSQGYNYFSMKNQVGKIVFTVMNYDSYDRPLPSTAQTFFFQKSGLNNQYNSQQSITVQHAVHFNGVKATDQQIANLENMYRVKAIDGRYWYDNTSGLWGIEGGPSLGVILPNLHLGGALKENASNGRTGVYINGRQLHPSEVLYLKNLFGYVNPGKYWLDAYGNVGLIGGPALVNLRQAASNHSGGNRGGNTFYRNSYTGIGGGSSGGTTYVIGKDFSYIGGN